MKNVLISGGNGLVGSRLRQRLEEKGYTVNVLSRSKNPRKQNQYYWDIDKMEIDEACMSSADYIIHLAGESIANKRWSRKQRRKIISSRTQSSRLIVETIKKNQTYPKAIISSSAIGYYGFSETDKIFMESDEPSDDFLGRTCALWEEEVSKGKGLHIRTVIIRTGIVLSKKGGALKKMNGPTRLGFGAALGSGRQYLPWIHIDDLCDIYIAAIEQKEWDGPFNAVAPEHVTNKAFMNTLASAQGKKIWLPNVPEIFLKLALGEMSQLLLKGNRISSVKLQKAGYTFKFPGIDDALSNLFIAKKGS